MSPSVSALSYVLRTTVRNRLRRQLARLKTPRYALATLATLIYLAFIFYRPEAHGGIQPGLSAAPVGVQQAFALWSTVALAVLAAKWWLFGAASSTLAFTPAEVQLLLPAPIPQRELILYRLARVQFSMLISATFVSLLFWRTGSTLPVVFRILGLWMLFSTTFMHQMGVTLVRSAATSRGRGLTRNIPTLVLVTAALAILTVTIGRAVGPVRTVSDLSDAVGRLGPALQATLPAIVLWPFHAILAPAYARSTSAWLTAIGPAAGILALHYVWVLRANATFEEAAADASAKRAARLAARAASSGATVPSRPLRKARTRLPLAPVGPTWIAIVWKNTLGFARVFRLGATIRFALILVVGLSVARTFGFPGTQSHPNETPLLVVGFGAAIGAFYLVVAGPLTVRNDLRSDLAHLATLRTYPLRPQSIVFAEILSSAVTLTLMQVALLLVAFALLTQQPIGQRASILAGAVVVLPAVNLTSLTIQNGIAILVPGWVRLGGMTAEAGQVGFELFGQRALASVASILAMLLALTPPVGAAVLFAMLLGGGLVAVTAAIILGLTIAGLEVWLAIEWLGRVLDRTDAVSVHR